jgi:FdhE protein
VAESFLRRWFGGIRKVPPTVGEARAELDRIVAENPAFRAPALWLRELLPDLAPISSEHPSALSQEQARAKLVAGIPLLRDEVLAIDGKRFQRRWCRACEALEALQPDGAATALAEAVRRGRLDPLAIVQAVTTGQTKDIRVRATELGLRPDLAATLARYTLFPEFTALDAVLAPLREGIGWERGECPTCGSQPLLGEFRGLDQSRYLRCGLCASSWDAARQWCPHCDNRDHETLSFLHREGEESRCRAALCDVCHGYVKMLSTLAALSPLSLLVADVATLHLDLAAAERGYVHD